jgi:hypothetical protein
MSGLGIGSAMQKIFGMAPAAAPVQQPQNQNTPTPPGNIPTQNTNPALANNPTVPADSMVEIKSEPKGLDAFADMWNIKPEDAPKPPESAFSGITPEAIRKVTGNTDFSKVITPDLLAAISKGGDEGVAATLQAINLAAQESTATSAENTMKLVDAALSKQREQFQTMLPGLIKNQNVSDNLRSKNPIFNHPAAKPMLEIFQTQLALKNPTASAAELQQKAEEFLVSFAQTANPAKPSKAEVAKSNETDWSEFF